MISQLGFFCFAAAAVVQAVYLFRQKTDPLSLFLLPAGVILLFTDIMQRSLLIGFPAVTNTYESLVFFSAVTGAILFVYRLRMGAYPLVREAPPGGNYDQEAPPFVEHGRETSLSGGLSRTTPASRQSSRFLLFGGSIFIILLLALASSPLAPGSLRPPVPALRSAWLVLHVTFAFVGEAFFAVSFVASVIFLFNTDAEKKRALDRIIYTTIAIGYPTFTAGALIFGAVWAQFAWGRYWGWDPKETWALVTWLVYTLYLHFRFIRHKTGTIPALIALTGFLLTMFTFLGVNFLLSGKHSYG